MRSLAAAAVLACVTGASLALAQGDQSAVPTFRAEFERRTDGQRVARVLPSQMLDRGVSGVAHLCCSPRQDRSLDCEVAFEWPERRRFGETALEVAEGMYLTPASLEEYQTQPGRLVHIPVEFRLLPVRREVAEALEGIAARSQNLCGVSDAPAEPIVITAEQVGGRRR